MSNSSIPEIKELNTNIIGMECNDTLKREADISIKMPQCKGEALSNEDIQNASNSINCNSADVKLKMECDILEERLDSTNAKRVFKKVNDESHKNSSDVLSKTSKKSSTNDGGRQLNKAVRTKLNAKVSKENKISNASTSVKNKKDNNKCDNVSNNTRHNSEISAEKKPEISADTSSIACSKTNGSILNKASPKKRRIISIQEYHRKRLRIIDYLQFKQEISFISINSQMISFSKKAACISVSFNTKGIHLELPRYKICKASKTIPVSLSESDVDHVLVYCDEFFNAFISVITSSKLGETLKANLKTYKRQSPYFNPDAETTEQLKFSFFLKNITDDIKTFLNSKYGEKLVKIDKESAATMLTSPPNSNSNSPPLSMSSIFVYPQVGGIQVKSNDIACLANGSFINDTIIEFYLKYIYHEKIPPDVRERTHIFSSFFYQALECAFVNQFKYKQKQETDIETVKKRWIINNTWTKNVDIFSKDFIFIPINRKRHWYLAVICHLPELFKAPKEIVLDSDSPEKEKTVETLVEPDLKDNARKTRKDKKKSLQEKREPSICFFDSMDNRTRMNDTKKEEARTIKEFLEKLWNNRNPDTPCDWKRLLFLKACCPQQKNRYDCGIYLLQYVESFFKKPISYFHDPLPDLRNWFPHDSIKHKRNEIKNVISELKQKHPGTVFSPETSCSNSSLDVIDLT